MAPPVPLGFRHWRRHILQGARAVQQPEAAAVRRRHLLRVILVHRAALHHAQEIPKEFTIRLAVARPADPCEFGVYNALILSNNIIWGGYTMPQTTNNSGNDSVNDNDNSNDNDKTVTTTTMATMTMTTTTATTTTTMAATMTTTMATTMQ